MTEILVTFDASRVDTWCVFKAVAKADYRAYSGKTVISSKNDEQN